MIKKQNSSPWNRTRQGTVKLLAFLDLFVSQPPFGYVENDALPAYWLAAAIFYKAASVPHPHNVSALADHTIFKVYALAIPHRLSCRAEHPFAVIEVAHAIPNVGLGQPVFDRITEFLKCRADV